MVRFAELARGCAFALAMLAPMAAVAERPRICVVLSGGGARGAAHIGVLKVLEEYRVPIDCIVGTSMGALVGAAYATGTTVAEMEKLVAELTTDTLFKERPPRQELSVRQKQDEQLNLVGPEIGLRGGEILLQKGIVSGVQLETVLRRLGKAKGYRRFDELPIPFRAVATDVVTGRAIVFGDGEIANVLRASMSVPGAIAPIEIGDLLLVDGGITNNLPVNIAREMGAQVVIAVNLGTPLLKREKLGTVVGVAAQMLFILTEQNVQASIATLGERDVLIEPALGDYSFSDFDNMVSTLPIGEAAARKVQGFLQRLAVSPAEFAALRAKRPPLAPPDPLPIDEIRFENLARVNPAHAASFMQTKVGEPIDQQVLDRDIRRLYGTGDFEHVNYRILDESGRRVLAIEAVEKAWGPNYLRFGLKFGTDFSGDTNLDLFASYKRTWLNSLGAQWKTDLQFGRNLGLSSEFYQPVDVAGRFFVAPRIELGRQLVDVFDGTDRIAQLAFRYARGALDVGTQFGSYGELRAGIVRGVLDGTVSTGARTIVSELGLERLRIGGWSSRLFIDQLDSNSFPRSGMSAGVEAFGSRTGLGAQDNYTKWDTGGLAAHSFGDNTFLLGWIIGGKKGAEPLPTYDQFSLGGFLLL
ncbi:MAG TPA: patatin-like phospholipase family protein, partial [Usitatibacter sp.]|nr:patatin-like phospholipase family protein [Usitatibacter sp.]